MPQTYADAPPALGIGEELRDEFAQTLATMETRARIPGTEEERENWARQEYPADMWLYDVLRHHYGYGGGWQRLLRESGELLRFDYPLTPLQPNCRPSILGLRRVAAAAGFTLILAPDGDISLPECVCDGLPAAARSIRLTKTDGARTVPQPCPSSPRPRDYPLRVAADDRLEAMVVSYLLVSGRLAEGPGGPMSRDWEIPLLSGLSAAPVTVDSCGCEPTPLQTVLDERQRCLRRSAAVAPRSSHMGPAK